jgi:hypothetical protein
VDVTLESINISPFKGRVEIRNLIVGNPEGYTSDHAVKLGFVNAELNIPSVFSDKLIIHEVTLKDVNVNYETKMFTSNIQQIIDNASQHSSSGNVPESDTKEKAEKKNKQEKDYKHSGKSKQCGKKRFCKRKSVDCFNS